MTVTLVLILIILVILIAGFIYIKTSVEKFSKKWFGTKDFFEGIRKQQIKMEETPKTPYGIDNLVLPEIQKDFPNMNVNQMKKKAEDSILQAFNAFQNRNVTILKESSDKLKNDIQSKIDELTNIKVNSVKVHKTVINKYDREDSICRLVFQSAVGYKISENGKVRKIQDRINTEFVYIYNYDNVATHESISLKCPSCGAPIQSLGVKVCPYCKSGIIDLATKTWKLNDIYKV